MKTDLYTKALLTLITLFLGVLAFDKVYEAAIPEAQAKTGKWKCIFTSGFEAGERVANKNNWSFMTTVYWPKDGTVQYCGRP